MSGGCKCCPISVKRNLKIEADEVVSECPVYVAVQSLTEFYVIIFYILFQKGGVNRQNIPLIMALRSSRSATGPDEIPLSRSL